MNRAIHYHSEELYSSSRQPFQTSEIPTISLLLATHPNSYMAPETSLFSKPNNLSCSVFLQRTLFRCTCFQDQTLLNVAQSACPPFKLFFQGWNISFQVSTEDYRMVFSFLFLDTILLVMQPAAVQCPCQPHHTLAIVGFPSGIISRTMACPFGEENDTQNWTHIIWQLRNYKILKKLNAVFAYYFLIWIYNYKGTSFGVRRT